MILFASSIMGVAWLRSIITPLVQSAWNYVNTLHSQFEIHYIVGLEKIKRKVSNGSFFQAPEW